MDLNVNMLRREARTTAGAGPVGVSLEASDQAQARPSEQMIGFGAATAPFRGKLYAVWKGSGSDAGLSYASFDGAKWSAPSRIPKVASSAAPSLAIFDGKLYAAWKGENTDQRLWYAAFDGSEWSPQAQIPGAASGSGPTLSVFKRKLHATWTGARTGCGLFWSSFDGLRWSTDSTDLKPSSIHLFPAQAIAGSGLSGANGIDQRQHNDCVFEASAAATARCRAAISEMMVHDRSPDERSDIREGRRSV